MAATVEQLERRLARLEETVYGEVARPAAPAPPMPVARPREDTPRLRVQPAPPSEPRGGGLLSGQSLEDLVGGRVLAWLGGFAVVLGVVFFFALAISRGWIGEGARTLLAGAGSLALLVVGVWLHERKGRTEAAVAASSAAVAALFLTIAYASRTVVAPPIALAVALAAGTVASALALRWQSRLVGALGMLGALLAPALVDAGSTATTIGILFIAACSVTAVLFHLRWGWLALAAFAVTAPQWLVWIFNEESPVATVVTLVAFGALFTAAAVGFELRTEDSRLRSSSAFLLALNAIVLSAGGWFALADSGHPVAAKAWLVALALAHAGVAVLSNPLKRVSHELAVLSAVLGVVIGDIALGTILHGIALGVAWSAGGVAFAAILKASRLRGLDDVVSRVGLGAHLSLALGQALVNGAGAEATGTDGRIEAVLMFAPVAAGCFVSARLAREGREQVRIVLDAAGLAVVAYLSAVALDGMSLVIAWCVEASALAVIARRTRDHVALVGGCAFLGGAFLHTLAFEVPPRAFVYGVDDLRAAAVSLAACAVAALRLATVKVGPPQLRIALGGAAAQSILYLASIAIVTAFQPEAQQLGATGFDLGVRQQGQVLVSCLWAIVGVGAVVFGLARQSREARAAGLGLLLVTVGKVFLFDLSTLTAGYRVASFVGLGLLLLAGSFAWQRFRPAQLRRATS